MRRLLFVGLASALLMAPAAAFCAVEGLDLSLSTELKYLTLDTDSGDDEDLDWRTRLAVDYAPPGSIYTLSTLMWYGADLDGTSAGDPSVDLLDTYEDSSTFRLYRAAVEVTPAKEWAITLGRQDVWSAERATLDGGAISYGSPCGYFDAEIFGGKRVSFFSDPDEDEIYGGNLDLRPSAVTKLSLSAIHYIEDTYEARIFQKLGSLASARIGYRHFNDEAMELSAEAALYGWEGGELIFSYLRKFSDAEDSYGFDYTAFGEETLDAFNFGTFAPYTDYSIELRQGYGDIFGYGKVRRHNVIDEADEDIYNTDFTEATAGLSYSREGLRIEVKGTRWVEDRDRSDLDEETSTGGILLVEKRYASGYRAGASLHRTNYDSLGKERETRGVAVWGTIPILGAASLDLRYERESDELYEDDGIDTVAEYTARLNYDF